jgi:hypothetical protein
MGGCMRCYGACASQRIADRRLLEAKCTLLPMALLVLAPAFVLALSWGPYFPQTRGWMPRARDLGGLTDLRGCDPKLPLSVPARLPCWTRTSAF